MPDDFPLQSQTGAPAGRLWPAGVANTRCAHALRFLVRRAPGKSSPSSAACEGDVARTALVIGRDSQGQAFALRDACPHRGMPLSCGPFDGEQIECSYHGWRFDAHSGQCQLIPSLVPEQNLKIERIYAGSYPCEERDDFIWVFIPIPAHPALIFKTRAGANSRARDSEIHRALQARLSHRQPALFGRPRHHRIDGSGARPFVHQACVAHAEINPRETQELRTIPYGFRMSAHTPSSNSAPYKLLRLYADADSITTTIDFVLPNLRSESFAPQILVSSLTTVTPITRNQCRIDVVAA